MTTGGVEPTEEELLAFAGLVRLLVRADGAFTKDEAAALEDAFGDLFTMTTAEAGPYRTTAAEARPEAPPVDVWALLDKAAAELPDDAAVLAAARRVTRPEIRDAMFGVLYVVAASDVISKSEWPILDWLTKEWDVRAG